MKKKSQRKHLKQLFKKMRQYFRDFVHRQRPEDLHGFRVQVKKVNSFLTLLQAGGKSDKLLKTFKPVKKIFKSGGVIRDAQVHQKQAKENGINASQFYEEQDEVLQKETGKLLKRRRRHVRKMKKVQQQLLQRLHAISKNEMEQFLAIQITQTEKLLKSHNFGEQLHNGRKMLKHLLYNRHVIPQEVATDMHINFDDIDAMQQVIGDWHDNKLALDFFGDKLSPEDLEGLKQKQEELEEKIMVKNKMYPIHVEDKERMPAPFRVGSNSA